ncbi:MAG: hypothetical protein K0Q79_1797 [Flavipsychrobacter sp.]|jgi:ketosteroid isomerase-like protein|nr:hypothetical protein [Flavipsychrobacter sp.]
MNTKIEQLFAGYEKAFQELDLERIASFYSETFISASPKGSMAQGREEFAQNAPAAADFYRKTGQTSGKILALTETPISKQYTMVKVHWGLTFEKTGSRLIEFDISYLVQLTTDTPVIILFIAHEDEEETMKELGLI